VDEERFKVYLMDIVTARDVAKVLVVVG